ncbi:serine hydrolase domain-containing protein [Winogradskyella aquimaris]|uniref:Serine hydrolase domain-containing protein n=1 Tax=Winogradskyella aquimaris TaxID=864074 RepID=A0ABU5EP27_9FLAO|nr:serine hydrolase domain-containing protein [Winogradskyella aquimaris]MDY2587812.1 serine hydrolase domain-containing protein [Winogradskyella aquimaris]
MNKRQVLITLITLLGLIQTNFSQELNTSSSDLKSWIDKQFLTARDSLNIPGSTFALVHKDSIVYIQGYGLADIENKMSVSDSTTLFRIASISKTFVGVSIMQLYEDGKLTLDEDVNTYLKSMQLDYHYEPPITIRHLLTHTAGIDESNLENRVRTKEELISLGAYLDKKLPPQIRPPGEAISYNNFGYALLGLIVEDISGLTFDEYVRINILEPLEMNFTSFKEYIFDDELYAKSYTLKNNELVAYPKGYVLQYPAGSIMSNAKEMSNYMSMFLNHGAYKNQKLLDSLTLVKQLSQAFKHYEKAQNGWLLGFYEGHWKGLRIVQHAGDIDGFASLLMLIPEKDIAVFLSVNSSSIKDLTNRNFVNQFTDKLLAKLFPTIAKNENSKETPKKGRVSKPLKAFEGVYRPTRYAQSTLDKVALFIGIRPDIKISVKNDRLLINGDEEELIPISNLSFYAINQEKYTSFKQNDYGNIAYYFLDNQAYHKVSWHSTLRFQITMIVSILVVFILFILGTMIRRLFLNKKEVHLVGKLNLSIAILSFLFVFIFGYSLMTTDPNEFLYGLPFIVKASLILPLLIIILTAISLIAIFRAIREKKSRFWWFNYLVTIGALFFIVWLSFWNLIGFNY